MNPTLRQHLAPGEGMNWQQIRARLKFGAKEWAKEDCHVTRETVMQACLDPLLEAYKKLEDKWPADTPRWPENLPNYAEGL